MLIGDDLLTACRSYTRQRTPLVLDVPQSVQVYIESDMSERYLQSQLAADVHASSNIDCVAISCKDPECEEQITFTFARCDEEDGGTC